jgi:hypothetical protein
LFGVFTTTLSIITDGGGGGGNVGGGGLLLHTFGWAYFRFFNNIVLPHKSQVPVATGFFSGFVLVSTITSSSDLICSSTFGGSSIMGASSIG